MQMVGERLGITEQFQGVDQIVVRDDGSLRSARARRRRQAPAVRLRGAPAVLGWATGHLPEPRNNPQVGMANMRGIMPALQRAKAVAGSEHRTLLRVRQPAEAAARDARGQKYARRRNRERDRRVDRGGITWNRY